MRTARPSSFRRALRVTLAPRALAIALLLGAPLLAVAPLARVAQAADEAAKPDPAYRAAMKRFLIAQRVPTQLAEQMTYSAADQVLGNLASSGVTITEPMQTIAVEESRKDFGKRFGDIEYLTDLYVELYQKHFSEKELVEIATFWESPVAKKLLDRTEVINEAMMTKLQETVGPMASALQTRVDQRLRAEGALGAAP